jgi:hypothetical protein
VLRETASGAKIDLAQHRRFIDELDADDVLLVTTVPPAILAFIALIDASSTNQGENRPCGAMPPP